MNSYSEFLLEITEAAKLLQDQDSVMELRILNTAKGTVSGYFSDVEALAEAAFDYNGKDNIYVTLNPVNPALLARANNRLAVRAKNTTTDTDIVRRKWLLIDIDAVRPSGISANKDERTATMLVCNAVLNYLGSIGWPRPVVADSGNGKHLLYSIDLPNNDNSSAILKDVLTILDFQFSNELAHIDTTTYNAGRLCRLYGTITCKGDNTLDRPHRKSSIIEKPETLLPVTETQLAEFASEAHILPLPQKKNNDNFKKRPEDVGAWLEKHGLKVAFKGPYRDGTKYILFTCPWNPTHTNQSAYVIQFSSGGMSAGCHHNSCSTQSWDTLVSLLDPNLSATHDRSDDEEKSQSELLVELGSTAEYFLDDIGEAYASIIVNNHNEQWKIKSRTFRLWLIKQFFDKYNKPPKADSMAQALGVLEAKALFGGQERTLQLRVAKNKDSFYYDLADKDWRAISISSEGCFLDNNPPRLFLRCGNTKAQVEPDFDNPDITLLLNHVRFKHDDDKLLYLIYIVSCFVPSIPHPVLVLSGEQGSAKTTSIRLTRSLVDPSRQDILSIPNGKENLAITLTNNYMPSFDNLDTLSAEKSDMLCMAVTGGGFSKRTLWTDGDETILTFKRCVTMNGINVVVTRPDLLDRSIILDLERIQEEFRKEESTVWQAFEADKPKILAGIFYSLSEAMSIYPSLELGKLTRMADFTRWGYAIAEGMGLSGDSFLGAYARNQERTNEEALSAHPVATAVIALMKNKDHWIGSVAELLIALNIVATKEQINVHTNAWPKAANSLSRRLKEVKPNLQKIGINFVIRHMGDAKEVSISKLV